MSLICQLLTEVYALNTICVNDRNQSGFICFSPRARYVPKMGIPCHFFTNDVNVLMMVLVNDGEQLGGIYCKNIFITEVNALIII